MFTTSAKNTMLNALSFATASLHTDFPGQTGANEVTGGTPAYARKAITVGAASGEQRTLSAGVTFDVPATTVRWLGFWDATPSFLGYVPNGGSPREFVVDTTANLIRSPGHALSNGQKIVFYNGTVPAPIVQAVIYFIISATTDTFQVSATSGGAAITFTGAGTSACLVSPITEDVYASQGTQTVASGTFALNL